MAAWAIMEGMGSEGVRLKRGFEVKAGENNLLVVVTASKVADLHDGHAVPFLNVTHVIRHDHLLDGDHGSSPRALEHFPELQTTDGVDQRADSKRSNSGCPVHAARAW